MNNEQDVVLKSLLDDIVNKYLNFISDKDVQDLVYRLVEKQYNKGLLKGELAFNMNFVADYRTVSFMQNFAFENVKKLNADLKDLLRKEVSMALMNRETYPQISKRVRDVLDSTIEKAKLITVTEGNRAFNMGHYQAAKESGLRVVKEWSSQPERNDNNPCPICGAMDGKQVGMNDKFVFSDGDSVLLPPKHPRCKCRVLYVQKSASVKSETTFQGKPGHWRTVRGRHIFFADDGTSYGGDGKEFSMDEKKNNNRLHHEAAIENAYSKVKTNDLAKLKKNLELANAGKDTQGLHSKNGVYSSERIEKVHKKIVVKYHELIKKAKSDNPKVVFMAGIPAAGKTYATKEMFSYDESFMATHKETGEKYVVLNPDNFKTELPEYDGGMGSTIVHEESSYLNKLMIQHAIDNGANVIVDAIMGDAAKAEKLVSRFHEKKYKSTLVHVVRDVEDAIDAALERFEKTGRFVYFENIPLSEPGVLDAVAKMKKVFHNHLTIQNTRKK